MLIIGQCRRSKISVLRLQITHEISTFELLILQNNMAIWIDDDLCNSVKAYVNKTWPEKRVRWTCKYRSWLSSRYIQISTPLKDMELHYELICGRVQLHFEGKFANDENKQLLVYLRDNVKSDGHMQWRRWMGMTQGLCEVDRDVECWDDLITCISEIINVFDPLINQFIKDNEDLSLINVECRAIPPMTYSIIDNKYHAPEPEVRSIGQIDFDKLIIPPYQRPYKWTAKNVNQLINDILTFRNKKQYRLGTLVLHNGEIVDGQQRIITLILLLKKMYSVIKDERKKEYNSVFMKKLDSFAAKANFPNRYSLHNIVENIHIIEGRESDYDDKLFDFVVNNCEFVVIELGDISEAFQFFDSQNARGKDLEAHDLLKAYHLREIESLSVEDSININQWQLQKTDFLKVVFLTLFRAKRWSWGKSAKYFTKNHTDVFKGISLRDGKRYPFYQMEVIAHIFSDNYSHDPIRYIDQNQMEYPYNLDDQIINGSRFFDMIRHYMTLYKDVRQLGNNINVESKTSAIINCINDYEGMGRTGDQYVRSMFDTIVLYYIDRFGKEELDKVIPKFFIWAYTLRLKSPAVQLASVDKYASDTESMFRFVHDSKTPYDIINLSQDGFYQKEVVCTRCREIEKLFVSLKKIYPNA